MSNVLAEYRAGRAIPLCFEIFQMLEESAEGDTSMGELPLLLAGQFCEGEVESGDEEERIITEAGFSTRSMAELAFDGAFGAEQDLAIAGEGQGADEAGGAVGLLLHKVQEESVIAFVARAGGVGFKVEVVCEARAADAGLVVESGDFEAGVVGEDQKVRRGEGVGDGFQVGVALEGGGVFDGFGYVFEAGKG